MRKIELRDVFTPEMWKRILQQDPIGAAIAVSHLRAMHQGLQEIDTSRRGLLMVPEGDVEEDQNTIPPPPGTKTL